MKIETMPKRRMYSELLAVTGYLSGHEVLCADCASIRMDTDTSLRAYPEHHGQTDCTLCGAPCWVPIEFALTNFICDVVEEILQMTATEIEFETYLSLDTNEKIVVPYGTTIEWNNLVALSWRTLYNVETKEVSFDLSAKNTDDLRFPMFRSEDISPIICVIISWILSSRQTNHHMIRIN